MHAIPLPSRHNKVRIHVHVEEGGTSQVAAILAAVEGRQLAVVAMLQTAELERRLEARADSTKAGVLLRTLGRRQRRRWRGCTARGTQKSNSMIVEIGVAHAAQSPCAAHLLVEAAEKWAVAGMLRKRTNGYV